MDRWRKIPAVCLVLCGLAASGLTIPGWSSAPPVPDQPNIILFSIDTLRADHLGCYGCGSETSPAIDEFARGAVRFANAFSQSPITAPSHMTLFTALSPPVHGVNNVSPEGIAHILPEKITTMAELLKRNGYRTLGFHGQGQVAAEMGFDRGFDEYLPLFEQWFISGADWPIFKTVCGPIQRRLQECRRREEPVFLFLHHYICHDPYVKGPRDIRTRFLKEKVEGLPFSSNNREEDRRIGDSDQFWKKVELAEAGHRQHIISLYDGGVYYSDLVFKSVIDLLKQNNIYENSIIILLSDHGEEFYEHGGKQHGRLWVEHLHVPLLIKFPGGMFAGTVIENPVRLMDVMPTLFQMLDISIPEPVQGVSFLPLITKKGSYSPVISSYGTKSHHEVIDSYSIKIFQDGYSCIVHDDSTEALMAKPLPGEAPISPGPLKTPIRSAEERGLPDHPTQVNHCPDNNGLSFDAFSVALRNSPPDFEKFRKFVELGRVIGRVEAAAGVGREILEKHPEQVWLYRALGNYYKMRGRTEEAISMFQKLIRYYPRRRTGYLLLVDIYLNTEQYERAEAILRKIGILAGDDGELAIAWGRYYRRIGRFSKAARSFLDAIKSGADESRVFVELSSLYYEKGDREKADEFREKAIARRPGLRWKKGNLSLFNLGNDGNEQDNLFFREDVLATMLALAGRVRGETERFRAEISRDPKKVFTPDKELSRQLKALGYMN